MRYVVFKGTAGWGDRLQCLLMAIRYAKATGRYLVMDWRDIEWAHNGIENFDDYLHLSSQTDQVKTMDFRAFLNIYQNTDLRQSTLPKVWRHQMVRHEFKDWLYMPLFCLPDHGKAIDDIASFRREDFEEDVVVYAGTGFRSFAYADFGCITLNRWVSEEIKQYAKQQNLATKAYDVIHLRGGSKKWAGGHVALKSLAQQIDTQFPDLNVYFKTVFAKYQELKAKNPEERRLCIVSDSKWLAEQWIATYKIGEYLDHSFKNGMEGSGIHEANEVALKARGSSKYQVNKESLRDFAVMLNARFVAYDGVSLFSALSNSCAGTANDSWKFN
ncbi:MAG: hypothetical protein QE278_07690 [Limnobacter sp.]|nr:hypothetical protein [Limnobacter sp.]